MGYREQCLTFIFQIRTKGFERLPDNGNFPASLKTIPELVEYATLLIWNSSIWHTAVNFGQFHYLVS